MKLSSVSLQSDGYFSVNCGAKGGNLSPAFTVADAPAGTASLALLLEDRDAFPVTGGFSWVHWAACNIALSGLEEGAAASECGFKQGLNSYISIQGGSRPAGECVGYCGMSPPDEAHIYTLRVFALDTVLDIEDGFNMNIMFRKMQGHVLDTAEISGWYDKV